MYNAIIVDDEPRTRQALIESVNWKKCSVRCVYEASNITEARKLLLEHKIDVLICDIEMPGGTGLELVDWVREQNYLMGTIMVTCHPEFSYVQKAIRQGCYDYILKPIDYEEFSRTLHEMTRKMEYYEDHMNGDVPDASISWGNLDYSMKSVSRKDGQLQELKQLSEKRGVEKEVKQYVKDHLADDLSVTRIAEVMHFNPQYLARTFRAETGQSILEYITTERVEAAKKLLLETNIPVKEIAALTGYQDYAYFTRVFKKETGVSPRQYRK